jgi:hypothetical protein
MRRLVRSGMLLWAWRFLASTNTGPGYRLDVVGPFETRETCDELAEWARAATNGVRQAEPDARGMQRYNISRCWEGSASSVPRPSGDRRDGL